MPIGRTAWYRFTGTCSGRHPSTVGSNFDTVIGVYEAAAHDQVACADDTSETGLLAEVTVPTVAGAAYLVQESGYAGDLGTLVLRRS